MKTILFTILVFFMLIPELFTVTNNRFVARVNDDVITLYELNSEIKALTGKTSEELQAGDEQEFFTLRSQILDNLITVRLINEKVRDLDIESTPEELDAYIEQLKKKNKLTQEEIVSKLKKQGLSYKK